MHDLLKKYENSEKLVALYTNPENCDNFHVAYILSIMDGKLLECNVGIHGEFDGYAAEYVEDIYRVETNTEYIKKIEFLTRQNFFKTGISKIEETEPFLFLINMSISSHYVATIYLKNYENQVVGYITNIKDGKVFVTMVSKNGNYDGETIFYYNDVVRIMVNDVENQELDYLYKKNNGK